jgi:hypothetical protein
VAQKYIERPLLYFDRKFDIRLWVLVTCNYDIYYYKNSYVRTSSSKYELNNTQDYIKHLTNNCFQVLSDTYGAHEEGNIISLKALEAYIKKVKEPSYTLEDHFFPWAVSHCVDVILSGQKKMYKVPTSYELFGFDLMIDEDLRVWLIECNVNPHLGTPNELMKKVVPEMLNEMLTIVLDPLIPPKDTPTKYEKGHWVLAWNTSMKNKEHIMTKSFYPIKAFAVPSNNQLREAEKRKKEEEEDHDDKKKKKRGLAAALEEIGTEDKALRKNVTLRIGNTNFNLLDPKKYKAYSIENIKELILKQLDSGLIDEFQLAKNIDRLFACFANWELYSDEQIKSIVKATKFVLDTPFDYLVVTEQNISILINMLKAEELRFELMVELIEIIGKIIQKKKLRVKFSHCVLDVVDLLARALYCFVHGEDSGLYPKIIVSKVCSCITNLCEDNDRSIYVPGESNEKDLVIMEVMLSGGFIVLLSIKNIVKEEGVTSIIENFFENVLDYDDLAVQKELLEHLADLYLPNGQYDIEKIMQFESVKNMPKRLNKVLNSAIQQVNTQFGNLFVAPSGNQTTGQTPATTNPPTPQASGAVPEKLIQSASQLQSRAGKEAAEKEDKEGEFGGNRKFYLEWVDITKKEYLIKEIDSYQEKKAEERAKLKAKEQKKLAS